MFRNIVFSIGRIENGKYSPLGTCTLIDKATLFVTAAHVVSGSDENLVIRLNENFVSGYQDTTENEFTVLPVKIVGIDTLRDVCVLSTEGNGHGKSGIKIGNTDLVEPGDIVTVVGFPHSNLGRIVLTQQTCEVGAKILLSSKGVKSKHLVLNIQTRPGQSGGPIIRKSDGLLIGILIGAYVPTLAGGISLGGIDPHTLHQTTHAVSAGYIERILVQ